MRPTFFALVMPLFVMACAGEGKTSGGTGTSAGDEAGEGADGGGGEDGAADGADGATDGLELSGSVACDGCDGPLFVALFAADELDPDTLFGAPAADLRLDTPGDYRFALPGSGDWRVLSWADEAANGAPDPVEPRALSEVVTVEEASVSGIDLTLTRPLLYGNAPDCEAHALDTVVVAAPLGVLPEDLVIDGDLSDWAGVAPIVRDPTATADDCGAGGTGATDITTVHLVQDTDTTALAVGLEAAPDPAQVYSVSLRQLDPAGHGPWGAGELELLVEHLDGDWQAVVVRDPVGFPEPVYFGPVGVGAAGFELALDRGFTGGLSGYRARAFTTPEDAGDETAFVELGHSGLADADGGPVPLTGGTLVLASGTTEAALAAELAGLPAVLLADVDEALGLADVGFELARDGSWEGDVEAAADVAALQEQLTTLAVVEAFLPHDNRQIHDTLVGNADLDAWTGHEHDVVAWATNTIQVVEAQQLFADCYPRVSAELEDVDVLVVDASINDADDARTGFDTAEFFFGEVSLGSSVLEEAWEEGQFAGTSWPHGLATSALIAKRTTAVYEGRGETATAVVPARGDAFVGDRMSGILAFGGTDGSPAPGNQAWEFPLNLGLWSSDWGGVAGKGWVPSMREGLASGRWDVMNASWGELAQGRYCVRDSCEWNFGEDGSCVCEGLPAEDSACGGWQRHNVTAAQVRAFGGAARGVWAANPDTLFVVSSGNDCLDLDDAGGVSAWAEVDGTEDNVMLVAGVSPGVSPDTVARARSSNHGDHAELAAPYLTLTWKPGIYYYKQADTFEYLTRLVWGYERGLDNTYRWAAGTSYSAPMTTAVAALAKAIRPEASPAWLKRTLLDAAEPIGVTEAPRLLNAPRTVARAVDDALSEEGGTHILTLWSTSFSSSCSTLEEGESMGDAMAVECALLDVDNSSGAVSGGGQLSPGNAESAHELSGTLALASLSSASSTFTLQGTDWMPGPGALPDDAQDHSWTRFFNVRIVQASDSSVATAVWRITGEFEGDAELYEDSSGEPQADCTWSGEFEGTLVETAHTGW